MEPEFRAIRPCEFDVCLDLWAKAFKGIPRRYFEPYFHGDPWFRRAYTRVCSLDGRLVSAVQVCERRVRVGSAELVMGGIGNVATDPDFRGRGYNTQCLSDAIRVMRRYGMDFSVLFTGIHSFYERLGWRSVPTRTFMGPVRAGLSDQTEVDYSIRTVDWSRDLDVIRKVHGAFNHLRPFTTCRTLDYWKGYVLPRFGAPAGTLVAENGGSLVGYVLAHLSECDPSHEPSRRDCWVKEVGHLPGHERCIRPLMRRIAVRAKDADVTLHATVPEEPHVLSALRGAATALEPRESLGTMCLVVNMKSLGRRLLPELKRRAELHKPPSGSLSFDTEMGSLAFTVIKGGVAPGGRKPIRISLSQPDFFSLLFGIRGIDELDVSIPGDAREIVSVLFPRQRPVFWLSDHF